SSLLGWRSNGNGMGRFPAGCSSAGRLRWGSEDRHRCVPRWDVVCSSFVGWWNDNNNMGRTTTGHTSKSTPVIRRIVNQVVNHFPFPTVLIGDRLTQPDASESRLLTHSIA